MGRELKVQLAGVLENQSLARGIAAAYAAELDPTVDELTEIKTAVSEAVTNAVIHGYGGGPGTIFIRAAVDGQEFTVEVRDDGVGIGDVARAMEPMFTTDTAGERSGMGFSFMEAFMDQVEVISAPGQGTRVIMKKRIGA